MEQQRVSEFLASRQQSRISGFEQVVASLDGIGQMHRPQSRLAGNAVQFLQSELRVVNRKLDACSEPVGKRGVRLYRGVVDDLREMRAHVGRLPLPSHAAAQSK